MCIYIHMMYIIQWGLLHEQFIIPIPDIVQVVGRISCHATAIYFIAYCKYRCICGDLYVIVVYTIIKCCVILVSFRRILHCDVCVVICVMYIIVQWRNIVISTA